MLIGIDVGGTFTDGVVFHEGLILGSVKKPTQPGHVQDSLLQVLDELLPFTNGQPVARVVLSTTLVTNLLATQQAERTALILLPGHGLPNKAYDIAPDTYFLKGCIDFRGRPIESLDETQVLDAVADIKQKGIQRVAVACKFSNRNNVIENELKDMILKAAPDLVISLSSEISGKLNFPRRAATTYFTAMILSEWNRFADDTMAAIAARNISAEIHILKADGGTIPLETSRRLPCESVFSGPAASTMGAVALTMDKQNAVVIDIGGTTTDLSLLVEGEPLHASKGARIEGKYTHINAFAVRSIALGGDSVITCRDQTIKVGPMRVGPAVCFGGEEATVTDVFNVYFKLAIGDASKSEIALEKLAAVAEMSVTNLAFCVIDTVIDRLQRAIVEMFQEWENEPAYKVWEVMHRRKFQLHRLIGIGAAAYAIVPVLSEVMGKPCFIHRYAPVANALGAAVVRPTLAVSVHVDTASNLYTVDPGGTKGTLDKPKTYQMADAKILALSCLEEISRERGIEAYTTASSFFMEEQFNMIRGWDRIGKIFEVGIQVRPGFIEDFKGVSQ